MLIDSSRLENFPVLSLHMGTPIAFLRNPIVDPNNLKLLAFELTGPEVGGENGTILDVRDIREFSPLGAIIDSSDNFVNPGDVIKLDKIMKLNFTLKDLKVETKKKTKLGKVSDFVVDTDTFEVRQLIVRRPPLKAFIDPELVIPKKEIVEITDYKVIVKDEEDKIKKKAIKEDFVPNFVNPFREPDFAPINRERE